MNKELKVIRQITSGQQSTNYVVEYQDKKYIFQLLDYSDSFENRKRCLLKLINVPHVVQLLHCQEVKWSYSDYRNPQLMVYEYSDMHALSRDTFSFKDGKELRLLKGICETVEQLHKRDIFHFDIKPENILASEDDFLMIDFGSALEMKQERPMDNQVFNNIILGCPTQTTLLFS